jgi:1-phosphofructokinase/tagatose 6-phosphate kinase
VIATGLVGGHNGARILDEMTAEGILNDFVRIRGESRTSTVVVDPTSSVQTEIYEYGPEIAADELSLLVEKLRYLSGAITTVVLGGSLPRKVPTSFYADVVRDMGKRKVRTVVDTDGEPMRLALAAEPSLVSPTQREAEALVGHEFQTDEDFQLGLTQIASMGAANVLITLKTGCYALLRSTRNRDRLYRAWIPRIESVATVGSADALLAGFLSDLEAERPPETCLRTALACAAANTKEVGAGVFEPRDVGRFAGDVEVQEISPRRAKAS